MRTAYKVLAYLVAAEVAIQAMVMVWGIAGLGKWVDGGGVLDKAVFEEAIGGGGMAFTEIVGLLVHGINGMFVIPFIALLLLIVSFFTKVRGAIKWALIVFALVVAQGQIGFWAMNSRSSVRCTASTRWCSSALPSTPVVGYGLPYGPMFRRLRNRSRRPRSRWQEFVRWRSAHEDSARRCGSDLDLRRSVRATSHPDIGLSGGSGHLPTFMGLFETYGGPWSAHVEPRTFVALLAAFLG